ncbi:hypothetical protein Pmar_PMAR003775 [Perkinsus marinus ATCC 50983]|uniref:Uncharacterized protein n=1 Tax=Perkinsus marinus (strain ATCC 50983 / TXsc) TaxID=423536 RepID=C5KEC0_PERM5|nr:hypothetical protein Pmar_PMAR003775 [Perkinsus marinus ATCC 50983]EER17178.1 hypothetical protein Pmar_PMAR003775 [Perkinsus marinus ATCC 50983]|eukprot:XP_002785382.1 hypothetical protein Pmar_PMAR003775 [Perkinsus marinus ATCC 50983]
MKLTMRRREVVVRKRWFVNEQDGFAVVHLRSIIDKVGVDSRTPQMNLEDVIILLIPMSEDVTFMTRVMEFDPDTNLIGFKLLEMTAARFGLRQLDDFEAMLSSPEIVKGLEPLPKPLTQSLTALNQRRLLPNRIKRSSSLELLSIGWIKDARERWMRLVRFGILGL